VLRFEGNHQLFVGSVWRTESRPVLPNPLWLVYGYFAWRW